MNAGRDFVACWSRGGARKGVAHFYKRNSFGLASPLCGIGFTDPARLSPDTDAPRCKRCAKLFDHKKETEK